MERGRKTKVLTIIALVVAIVTMSLGFAVFSNVLTISSSATVKPNAEDFVISIYGAAEEIPEDVLSSGNLSAVASYFTSKTVGMPVQGEFRLGVLTFGGGAYDAAPAVIDNNNFTIGNLKATFTQPFTAATYPFVIMNEGKNDVYLNGLGNDYSLIMPSKTCTASEEISQSIVDEECEKMSAIPILFDSNLNLVSEQYFKIVPGDFVILLFGISSNSQAEKFDFEFEVEFDNVELEFSSVDNSQSS